MIDIDDVTMTRSVRWATLIVVGGSNELVQRAGLACAPLNAMVRTVPPGDAIKAAERYGAMAVVVGPGAPKAIAFELRARAARIGAAIVDAGGAHANDDVDLEAQIRDALASGVSWQRAA